VRRRKLLAFMRYRISSFIRKDTFMWKKVLVLMCNNATSIYVEKSISILYGMWKREWLSDCCLVHLFIWSIVYKVWLRKTVFKVERQICVFILYFINSKGRNSIVISGMCRTQLSPIIDNQILQPFKYLLRLNDSRNPIKWTVASPLST
jgi:hypothetical protein